MVVVHEVAVAGHPHISGDEHADGVVDLPSVEVVVQQKEHLRTEPLSRLTQPQHSFCHSSNPTVTKLIRTILEKSP